ncbi:MAG: LytTR family DNA-binding domain-containing protein [Bacteroidota bacterium]
MIKTVVIDDQEEGLNLLVEHTNRTPSLELVGEFQDAVEALTFVKENPVDCIITDVRMPVISGIELVEMLDRYFSGNPKPYVILCTAYTDYAEKSYDHDRIIGYMNKPCMYTRFLKSIQTLERKFSENPGGDVSQTNNSRVLFLPRGKGKVRLFIDDIIYIKGERNSIVITLESGKDEKFYQAFHSIEEKLSGYGFIRIHRSYIVNINRIESVEGNTLRLEGFKVRFPIGTTYKSILKEKI